MKTAEEHFDDGSYQEAVNDDMLTAIQSYSEAIRLNPEFAEAFFNRGVDYQQLGDLARAVADFRRYTELRPDEPTGHAYLADVILDIDDPDLRDIPSALKHAECACRLAGESDYVPLTTLAAAYEKSGRFVDAIACQKKAIQVASQDRESNDFFVPNMRKTLAHYEDEHRKNKPWWKFW